MAHHKSAQKRIRQTERRTAVNRARKIRIKSSLKKVELAITAGNKSEAAEAFKAAQPELMRGVTKGVVRKETASRKLSRLSARIKSLAA